MADSFVDEEFFSSGKKPLANFENDNLLLGDPNITQNTLSVTEPLVTGHGRLFCLEAPRFMPVSIRNAFKILFERSCKGVEGLANYEVQSTEWNYGNNGETMAIATGIKKGNNTFTLKMNEFQGSPMRKMMKYWATGMFDLNTGYGHYHGRAYDNNIRHCMANHSAVFLYVHTDNSGGAHGEASIEFANLWYAAIPDMVKNEHFNWTAGEHNIVEFDIPMKGVFVESDTITTFAGKMLEISNFHKNKYEEFNMGSIVDNALEERSTDGNDYVEPLQSESNQYEDIAESMVPADPDATI